MRIKKEKGFTLIEILLVVVIIGIMLAVIVPRAWRANIDSKYGLVRQNCSELASFGMEWAENQLLAQEEYTSEAVLDDYICTLTENAASSAQTPGEIWVGNTAGNSNWNRRAGNTVIPGRWMPGSSAATAPEACVEDVVPPEKIPRNPFNNVSVFAAANDPGQTLSVITGAVACGGLEESANPDRWRYYAFLFQGTDSTSATVSEAAAYFAGMEPADIAGLRNGIFFARLRPGVSGATYPTTAP